MTDYIETTNKTTMAKPYIEELEEDIIQPTVKHPYTPGLASEKDFNYDEDLDSKIKAIVSAGLSILIITISIILLTIYG